VVEGKNIRGVVAAEAIEEGVALPGLQGELETALSFEPGDSDLQPELETGGEDQATETPEIAESV
jgi:hypothetical protein